MSTIGELPNLRVQAAWKRAEAVGAEHGVPPKVAHEIAREPIPMRGRQGLWTVPDDVAVHA